MSFVFSLTSRFFRVGYAFNIAVWLVTWSAVGGGQYSKVNFERLEESPMDAPDSGHIGSPGRDSNDEAWILILAACFLFCFGGPLPHNSFDVFFFRGFSFFFF